MNRIIFTILRPFLLLGILLGVPLATFAQDEEPIITFKTSIYETVGANNSITVLFGSIKETTYIDVDCGWGLEEHELVPAGLDTSSGEAVWTGTSITLNVSSAGEVKVYGDPTQFYIADFEGCYITQIDISKLTELNVLNLCHNQLEALDLTPNTKLYAAYLDDNPFDKKPLIVGKNKPDLTILEMGQTENLDQSFNLSDYPKMQAFEAYANRGLRKLDPTGCPELRRISIDGSMVESLDVSKNTKLNILNISETRIRKLDLSNNPYINELYLDHQSSLNGDCKFSELDISNLPALTTLFATGNNLTKLDVSKCPYLRDLYLSDNCITDIDLSNNGQLLNVILRNNCFDFATLPAPNIQWSQYDYYQRNMPVAGTVKVGDAIDLSARVLRENTVTECAVYTIARGETKATLLDTEYYTYENGKVTFTKAPTDSVYIAFTNDLFPDLTFEYMPLRTNKFKVKRAIDYGKEDLAMSFTGISDGNGVPVSMRVGIAGASEENPKRFYVMLDQEKVECVATSETMPATANVTGTCDHGYVSLYIPEDDRVLSLGIEGTKMASINLTELSSLRELSIDDAGLYDIDLRWNLCLKKLRLTGNNFNELSIRGYNDAMQKTLLTDINLSNNNMKRVVLNDMGTIHHLDLSHNQLDSLSFKDADYIETLNLSYNNLTELNLNYCTLMTRCDLSHNSLTSIVMPTEYALTDFICNDNNLTFASLPQLTDVKGYIYAPQADISIPSKAPGVDLQEINVENKTTYTWVTTDGATLAEGTDYNITDGMTSFLDPAIGKMVKCTMTSPLFPELTLQTTVIEAAGMPTHVLGTFKTLKKGTASLILRASVPNTVICIDWKGQGVGMRTYEIGPDMPYIFDVTTNADGNVSVYSYEDVSNLTVFSLLGSSLADVDLRGMTQLTTLNLKDAGLTEIKMPESDALKELSLDGNNFTELDLTRYPGLVALAMNSNKLTTFDATQFKSLQLLALGSNQLTSVKLNNSRLWSLDLSGNQLEDIDLKAVPMLNQVSLSANKLSSIDLSGQYTLKVIFLDNNRFTFKTLPKNTFQLYTYANQATVEVSVDENGCVDLSDQATVFGTPTTFRWFVDDPYYDEETGELTGEELYVDEEYTVTNGVTKFLANIDNVVCAMLNTEFPNLTLLTNHINATTAIKNVEADELGGVTVNGHTITVNGVANAAVYRADGALVGKAAAVGGSANITVPAAGVYVVKSGEKKLKIAIR
ncbi:MAG: hypothetical protein ACI3Y5_03995 [Prevotella sp.]